MIRAIAACLAALAALAASAQQYPAKTVRIIVPYSAGGPADIYARVIAEKLQASLGQTFVVEDRPGAGAIVGTEAVVQSAPDGYTLLMMSNTLTVNESLIPDKHYVLMRDLVPVAPVNYSDLVMVVHPSVKAANLKEFLALAKAEPGKFELRIVGAGHAVSHGGRALQVDGRRGHRARPVQGKRRRTHRRPRRPGADDVRRDHDDGAHVRAGKLRALATSGKTRSTVLPEVPTLDEAGVPGYEAVIWLGIMVPAGTPDAIVDKLNGAITKVTQSPDVKKAWAAQGATSMSMTPDEFSRFMRYDIDKWAHVVKASGAKPDQ